MRYIAIFLLLANIGYFSWIRYSEQPIAAPVTNTPKVLINSGLTLVSEYEAEYALKCFIIENFNTIPKSDT